MIGTLPPSRLVSDGPCKRSFAYARASCYDAFALELPCTPQTIRASFIIWNM